MTSHNPEDVVTEFFIDGAWVSEYNGVDLAARVRGDDAIQLTAGGSDQFSSINSRMSNFTLNNRDNLFTDDDPSSPLHRKFGQSVRVRHSLLHATRGQDLYVKVADQPLEPNGTRIYTADKATLDITGDIDVRWEMNGRNPRDLAQFMLGKFQLTGNNLSWAIFTNTEGKISFMHSTGGSAGTIAVRASSVAIVPENEQRLAYRVTLDVNDGAGNRVYTWYTSDHIDGTWTQVDTATVAGTTSIYSGAGPLSITAGGEGDIVIGSVYPFRGKMYGAQVRDGINGTLVADFNPNADGGLGLDSWADTCATPNTWVLENAGQDDGLPALRVASDRVRFTGEIQTRPDDWDVTGVDRWCPMTAQGTLARYQSTRAEIKSTVRRYMLRQSNLVGYWPLEDGRDSTAASNDVDGGFAGILTSCSFGDADGFDGSAGSMTLDEASLSNAIFRAKTHTATGAWSMMFYFNLQEFPGSDAVIANIYPRNSSIHRWVINVNATGFNFQGYAKTGGVASSSGVNYGAGVNPVTGWVAVYMAFEQVGGDIRWQTAWHQVGQTDTYTHLFGGTTFAGTVGTIDRLHAIPINAALDGMRLSHVMLWNYEWEITSVFAQISRAYSGETWGRRWIRLLSEEGIGFDWIGDIDLTEECGPQPITTLYDILEEGAKLDGGLVTEARDMPLLWTYVTGAAMGNRRRLELSYSGNEIVEVPRPVGDGRYTVNDFTASRRNGAGARYEANDFRRKNVREQDDANPGVGRVERSDSYNAYLDDRMWYIASNRVHLGTWEERIIPKMTVSLHRDQVSGNAALADAIFSQDIGDPIAIVDVVAPMPPNEVHSIVTGYTETIKNLTHDISFNTVNQGPYDVPILESRFSEYAVTLAEEHEETVLKTGIDSTATSITWKTDATSTCPYWVDDTNYPDSIGGGLTLNIDIGGEVITVSSITAPSLVSGFYEQTATVSARSVNSVVKSHDANAVVRLADPSYLGRM